MECTRSASLTPLYGSCSWGRIFGSPVMADQEETFSLQNSPGAGGGGGGGGSDSRDLQNDNKSEKQNGTSSKSPSSQTTYIQQVSACQCV